MTAAGRLTNRQLSPNDASSLKNVSSSGNLGMIEASLWRISVNN